MNKVSGLKWAIAFHEKVDKLELFDIDDNSIDSSTFEKQTGFDPSRIVDIVKQQHLSQIQSGKEVYRTYINILRDKARTGKLHRIEDINDMLEYIKDPVLCNRYITDNGYGDYSKGIVAAAVRDDYRVVRYVKNLSISSIYRMWKANVLPSTVFKYITAEIPEDIQAAVVSGDSHNIELFNHPSPRTQMAAVKANPAIVSAIEHVDLEVARYVLSIDADYIQHFYYQSPEFQQIAVENDPYSIRLIYSPTVASQLAAYNSVSDEDKDNMFYLIRDKSPELVKLHKQRKG